MCWRNWPKRLVWALVLVSLATVGAYGDDVTDLKAVHEHHVTAVNQMDLDAFMAGWHDQVVYFSALSPFPVDSKAVFRQSFQNFFATSESFTLIPRQFQYRVIDNTGLVWGHFVSRRKPKDGPAVYTFNRYTATYVRSGGKWLLVSSHSSPIKVGN